MRPSEEIRPPPRKSRLFKTRAETKRAQANWTSLQERESESKRWGEDTPSGKENIVWRQQQERWEKEERRPRVYDGKNTLQRSLSSPEFQAELLLAARRVRSKMNYQREGPVGEATTENHREYSAKNEKEFSEEGRRVDGKIGRYDEERRTDNRGSRNQEAFYDHRRTELSEARYSRESIQGSRQALERNSWQNKVLKKSTTYDDELEVGQRLAEKKLLMNRIEKRGQSLQDDRLSDKQRNERSEERRIDHQRHNERLKNGGRGFEEFVEVEKRQESRISSASPIRQYREKNNDRRSQGSGRESTPEPPKSKELGNFELRNNGDPEFGRGNYKNGDKRRSEPVTELETKDLRSKEKLLRKSDLRSPPVKNWEM